MNQVKSGNMSTITIQVPDGTAPGRIVVPLIVSSIPNLGAFQFTIRFNPEQVSFTEAMDWFEGIKEPMVATPAPGILTFIWAGDVSGISINGTLCQLVFDNHQEGAPEINWADSPTPCAWYDFNAEKLDIGQLKSSTGSGTGIDEPVTGVIHLYPNPGKGIFNLSFAQRGNAEIALSVYNTLGLQVARETFPGKGTHQDIRIDLSNLTDGVYFMQVQTANEKITKKIIIKK
jgi:hypothetical protein